MCKHAGHGKTIVLVDDGSFLTNRYAVLQGIDNVEITLIRM
jgi:hypothetical protein